MASNEIKNNHIIQTALWLTEEIPLYVYLVRGADYSVFIDSGIKSMFSSLLETARKSGVTDKAIKYILHTHSHHDHIGSNAQLKAATGCKVAAHPQYAHWHSDFERHYQEFARPFPEIIEDTPALRSEVMDFLDHPHQVDLLVDEGSVFHLGGGPELEAFRFSGHMTAELGWYEKSAKTLILGDVITLMDAPFIHGHLTVRGYRQSLQKISELIDQLPVESILMAHFPPSGPDQVKALIGRARQYLDKIESTILQTIQHHGTMHLEMLWLSVCKALDKIAEFRALSTVYAHVEDLKSRNLIIENTDRTFTLIKA